MAGHVCELFNAAAAAAEGLLSDSLWLGAYLFIDNARDTSSTYYISNGIEMSFFNLYYTYPARDILFRQMLLLSSERE